MTTGPSRPSELGPSRGADRAESAGRTMWGAGRAALCPEEARGNGRVRGVTRATTARARGVTRATTANTPPSPHSTPAPPPLPPRLSAASALQLRSAASPLPRGRCVPVSCGARAAQRAQHGPAAGGLAWGRADTHPPAPTRGIRAGPWQVSARMKPALLCSSHICTPCAVQTPRRNQNLGTRDVSSAHVGSRCSALELTAFA